LGLGGLVAAASLLADYVDALLTGNDADGLGFLLVSLKPILSHPVVVTKYLLVDETSIL
jgi:hypothetical protein